MGQIEVKTDTDNNRITNNFSSANTFYDFIRVFLVSSKICAREGMKHKSLQRITERNKYKEERCRRDKQTKTKNERKRRGKRNLGPLWHYNVHK